MIRHQPPDGSTPPHMFPEHDILCPLSVCGGCPCCGPDGCVCELIQQVRENEAQRAARRIELAAQRATLKGIFPTLEDALTAARGDAA